MLINSSQTACKNSIYFQVSKCKPGEYERGTYFCGSCQTNSLEAGPSTNSILGWVSSGVRADITCVSNLAKNKKINFSFCLTPPPPKLD